MKKFFIIFLSVLVLAILGGSYFSLFADYSEGVRSGKVIKFSRKGVAFKTWEGELNTGAAAGSDGSDIATTTWSFSVYRNDDETRRKIQEAMNKGEKVELHYEQKFFQFDWRGDTDYFVTDVRTVQDR